MAQDMSEKLVLLIRYLSTIRKQIFTIVTFS